MCKVLEVLEQSPFFALNVAYTFFGGFKPISLKPFKFQELKHSKEKNFKTKIKNHKYNIKAPELRIIRIIRFYIIIFSRIYINIIYSRIYINIVWSPSFLLLRNVLEKINEKGTVEGRVLIFPFDWPSIFQKRSKSRRYGLQLFLNRIK